ncbi:MAG TPA: hypothetical protein VM884_00225, partial [Flavisolibacter sp.]|nr:hypothetical protein [Flavisolibacter sp.]
MPTTNPTKKTNCYQSSKTEKPAVNNALLQMELSVVIRRWMDETSSCYIYLPALLPGPHLTKMLSQECKI